jgi:hypothetical protein
MPGPLAQGAGKTVMVSSTSVTLPSLPVKVTCRIVLVWPPWGGGVTIGEATLQFPPGQ